MRTNGNGCVIDHQTNAGPAELRMEARDDKLLTKVA
jgi:hypothetical protein